MNLFHAKFALKIKITVQEKKSKNNNINKCLIHNKKTNIL